MKLIAQLTPYEQSISMAQNRRGAGISPKSSTSPNTPEESKVMEPS